VRQPRRAAILGVTLHGGAKHDTKTIDETLVAGELQDRFG
jgi:hypothetical protein